MVLRIFNDQHSTGLTNIYASKFSVLMALVNSLAKFDTDMDSHLRPVVSPINQRIIKKYQKSLSINDNSNSVYLYLILLTLFPY